MLSDEKRNADPLRLVDGSIAVAVPPTRIEPARKRVRVVYNGETVVDSTHALLVWEHAYYPRYYFPIADVHGAHHNTSGIGDVADHVALDWNEMDAWFEEDEEVFVHARNPYVRIDALRSSRTVRIEIEGIVVAESTSPVVLFETGLPARYYLPALDVRRDLLTPTDLATSCPYKGTARYWSIGAHANVVWAYPSPLPESQPVQGLMCFYNEKVDLFVDGELVGKPVTPFS